MIEKIRRAPGVAASQPEAPTSSPLSRTRYHWRYACGADSRSGGWLIASDAEYNGQRHMGREGVGHPMPEVYSTEVS